MYLEVIVYDSHMTFQIYFHPILCSLDFVSQIDAGMYPLNGQRTTWDYDNTTFSIASELNSNHFKVHYTVNTILKPLKYLGFSEKKLIRR